MYRQDTTMQVLQLLLAATAVTLVHATNSTATDSGLTDVCSVAVVQAALPENGFYAGITFDASSVTANPVYNTTVSGSVMFPDAVFDFCNVTFSYSHDGKNDSVLVAYWLPAPANFQNRFLTTGGGGYAINSGLSTSGMGSLPGGVRYGAVAGLTDGGFGGFGTNFDAVFPVVNGTANFDALFMFGYQALHEMTVIGKEFTSKFFGMGDTKLFTYYQGCSEGGREGWSQIQRFPEVFDGAITGAPAFRFAHQQVQHLWSNVVEQNMNYFPPTCELEAITNATISACDGLDGKIDGVVSRSDLCKLKFDFNSTVGIEYSCDAAEASPFGGAATPAQNGTVTAQGAAVASAIIEGMKDDDGKQVYLSYQPAAASFADAATAYNSDTGAWELSINSQGTEFITRFIQLLDTDILTTLANVTGSTLRDWIYEGWQTYEDTLQTTWPDLTGFQAAGGKVLHYHGESDNSIPTASSVRYYESVRSIMYGNMTFNESTAAMATWYQLYLVPGAAHCSTNDLEANGPFPQTNLGVMIDWVENGIIPVTLNATHLGGDSIGTNAQICAWPLRPTWINNSTDPICEYDQASIDSWIYDLNAFKLPVY